MTWTNENLHRHPGGDDTSCAFSEVYTRTSGSVQSCFPSDLSPIENAGLVLVSPPPNLSPPGTM